MVGVCRITPDRFTDLSVVFQFLWAFSLVFRALFHSVPVVTAPVLAEIHSLPLLLHTVTELDSKGALVRSGPL